MRSGAVTRCGGRNHDPDRSERPRLPQFQVAPRGKGHCRAAGVGPARAQPHRPDGRRRRSGHGALRPLRRRLGHVAHAGGLHRHRRSRRRLRELPQLAPPLPGGGRGPPAGALPPRLGGDHPPVQPLRHRARTPDGGQGVRAGVRLDAPGRGVRLLLPPLPRRPGRRAQRREGETVRRLLPQRGPGGPQLRSGEEADPVRPQRIDGAGLPQLRQALHRLPLRPVEAVAPALPRPARHRLGGGSPEAGHGGADGAHPRRAHGARRRGHQPRRHHPGHQRLPVRGRGEVPRLGGRVHRELDGAHPRERRRHPRQRRPVREGRGVHRRQVVGRLLRLDLAPRLAPDGRRGDRRRRERGSHLPRPRVHGVPALADRPAHGEGGEARDHPVRAPSPSRQGDGTGTRRCTRRR